MATHTAPGSWNPGPEESRLLARLVDLYRRRDDATVANRPAMAHACELAIYLETERLQHVRGASEARSPAN